MNDQSHINNKDFTDCIQKIFVATSVKKYIYYKWVIDK